MDEWRKMLADEIFVQFKQMRAEPVLYEVLNPYPLREADGLLWTMSHMRLLLGQSGVVEGEEVGRPSWELGQLAWAGEGNEGLLELSRSDDRGLVLWWGGSEIVTSSRSREDSLSQGRQKRECLGV